MVITPIDILDAREKRAKIQEELIIKTSLPILIIRANYPGLEKNNNTSKYIVTTILEEVRNNLKYKSIEIIDSYEGLIFLLAINLKSEIIKNIAIEIERNHPLGRLVDIDVINIENTTLSRTKLGYSPRSCFICDEIAHGCVRSQKHSLEEILNYIDNIVNTFKTKG
ncbi:MAG: citrate lyase holo-[acyl-carrier protein] synthase [Psychrilyobacter sp.]|nr:citrate lyase holo-[acyl-carrier protein] synthase [Psychrilyobacter sp.]